MATCSFCGRKFCSAQAVRAHLKTCPNYLRYKQRPQPSARPRARSALTDEEHIRRLFGSAPSASRTPVASTVREPQPATPRPIPGPERDGAHEQRAQEARRAREAREDAQRRLHRMFSGDFFCPRCDEEFALDRVPENEALCPNCRVALEEFEADEGDDDGE